MPAPPKNLNAFDSLVKIVQMLRGPQGCPWDKEQTHRSLTRYAIEEVFELVEAIESEGKKENLIEELGDVLFQVVLHAEIAHQEKHFTMSEVIQTVCEKMVRRHPHVFSNGTAQTSQEVVDNWQKIKSREKDETTVGFDVPLAIPALMRSQKIGEKTKKVNFDWNTSQEVLEKIDEELCELKNAIKNETHERQQQELGDLLFSIAQLARHLNFDAEQALRETNQRFEKRFFDMQHIAKQSGRDFSSLSQNELEALWEKVKQERH